MTPTSTPRLSGLSPKQNRTVPPIRPELARRLKAELPGLHIELNGTRRRGAALPFSTNPVSEVSCMLAWCYGVWLL
jgi:tRNA-dihydrouridine synthase A